MNFAPLRDIPRAREQACPLAAEPSRLSELAELGELDRMLFVRLRDRMRLVRTDTRDFTTHEIGYVKRLGQIYLDLSSKLAPDDFSTDLRKLELEAECASCPESARCAGCHRPSAHDVFARDEARVRQILRSLEGDVLDVGAGLAPYAGELEPAVRAGTARYFALDPDRERLELLRARYPFVEAARAKTLDGVEPGRRFSHVLLLRSFNHLPDARATLARAVALLNPAGSLLIVDDIPFGLVRSHEQRERAERSAAGFEHYRNASSAEVVAWSSELRLRLIERHDVESRSSTQWLLRFEREPD